MAKYSIEIKKSAQKEIDKLKNKSDRQKVIDIIYKLEDNPRPHGCIKLTSQERYRYREGDFRIVYEIYDKKLFVYVVKVGDRKDIYKH